MDEEQKYKLITCVDPRKINVPLRDRFAKLTLSNKKKRAEMADTEEGGLERDIERVKRVSRNISEALDNANDNEHGSFNKKLVAAASTVSNLTDIPNYVNPLLRSDSSGSIPVTQIIHPLLNSEDVAISMEKTQTDEMPPLQVSENFNQSSMDNLLEYEICSLTKQVSEIAVSAKDLNGNRNNKIAHENTLLMSTESQRMSCELQSHRLQTCLVNFDDGGSALNKLEQSICISLSSSEDSGSAITVTDSSGSEFMDFDCVTSEIPESGHTADAFIPNTFSNEKADRMEAFLRDVSQQRRELKGNKEIDIISSNDCGKAEDRNKPLGGLAYADTESMTTFSTEHRISEECGHILNIKQEQGLEKDTWSMSQIDSNDLPNCTSPNTCIKENKKKSDNPCRLANDETQVDPSSSHILKERWSEVTETQSSQQQGPDYSICSEQSLVSYAANPDVPEDSVVISETSSENVSGSFFLDSRCSSKGKDNNEYSLAVESEKAQISPQYMEIGSINISAKINIKISISQMDSSEDVCENESNKENIIDNISGEDIGIAHENENNENTTTPYSKDNILERTCDEQRQDKSKLDLVNVIEEKVNENINSDEEEVDVNFLTHAERLLNQVYGMSWKTPEVIRTLKRTSRTPKKLDCTPSPQTSNKTPALLKERKLDSSGKHNVEPANGENEMNQSVEQSLIDDFSIFRRDIVRTNLDSTRFITPKAANEKCGTTSVYPKLNSEPHCISRRNKQWEQGFKVPKTEVKRKCSTKRQQNIVAASEHWRLIVDENSETSGDNASDDDTLDETENIVDSKDDNKENKGDDYQERCLTSNESTESDYEISRPKKGTKVEVKKRQQCNTKTTRRQVKAKSKNAFIYLDLSKDEVTIQKDQPRSPPANNDAQFNTLLEDILHTCKAADKAKLPATPNTEGKSKRKLFTANFGDEDVDLTVGEDGVQPRTPVRPALTDEELILKDMEQVKLNDGSTGSFAIFNKHLEAIKRGDPIFQFTPPRVPVTPKSTETPKQAKILRTLREREKLADQICPTPKYKYGFLKSLDVCVAKSLCHPDALSYRENYRTKKEELSKLLYELYNTKLFQNQLNVPVEWNKKLCNTAGRCLNKKKLGVRMSVIELSEKVLTSADRLRCTLIHELCHAATWVLNGEGGHGSTWKQWASKANHVFPEIPKIGVCHQYDIEYKYTYKCTLCGAKSHAHSKSKKVENIRCSFCHGAIEIFLNKKDKDGNILPTPVREPTGFAKFVKDNYKQYKRPDLKHADVMKLLSLEFAALKVQGSGN